MGAEVRSWDPRTQPRGSMECSSLLTGALPRMSVWLLLYSLHCLANVCSKNECFWHPSSGFFHASSWALKAPQLSIPESPMLTVILSLS